VKWDGPDSPVRQTAFASMTAHLHSAIRPRSITQIWVGMIEPAGMILREDGNLILTRASKVVPHFIEG
jgi:glutathionylspermidine synthase